MSRREAVLRSPRVALLTAAAMVAFASNSILTRLALGSDAIDAASFTTIRLGSGALTLYWLVRLDGARRQASSGSWASAAALFAYAAPFSYAYLRIGAATGALLLFATVQTTMIGWGLLKGDRLSRFEWMGVALAMGGLVWLTLPGATSPDALGTMLMITAGAAWAAYSLRGQRAAAPLRTTADNFVRSVPFAVVLSLSMHGASHMRAMGVACAVTSGALASGVGYAVWYAALPRLAPPVAAVVQLSVPALAGLGGLLLLREPLTLRWASAATAITGGIALVIWGRAARSARPRSA